MREGSNNGNWKGGICSFITADELLLAPKTLQDEILRRLIDNAELNTENDCWEWTGGVFKSNGRACLSLGKRHLAYRLMYVLQKGPTNGLLVLHRCDNVLCINPEHLFLGTNKDNSTDMILKGRQRNQDGSLNSMAKLDEDKVRIIKQMLREGYTQRAIAKEFGVHFGTISLIKLGYTWSYVV